MSDIFKGRAAPLSREGWQNAVDRLGVTDVTLWTFLTAFAVPVGYHDDRRPRMYYYPDIFYKRTNGRIYDDYPGISSEVPDDGGRSVDEEYKWLERAMLANQTAALESACWGLAQMYGYHATSLGYQDVQAMTTMFRDSEDAQLEALVCLIMQSKELLLALRAKDWLRVTSLYRKQSDSYGKPVSEIVISTRAEFLASTYAGFSAKPDTIPDIDVRAAQVMLYYLGYRQRVIAGVAQYITPGSIGKFRQDHKLEGGDSFDSKLLDQLKAVTDI